MAARLLQRAEVLAGEPQLSVGFASAFGEVEGGAGALVDSARAALAEAGPRQVVGSRSHHGRPAVLLVDNDLAGIARLAEMLSERGWEGYPCATEEEALRRVAERRYSAVFLDLALSHANGMEILRAALTSLPGRPVVLMSGGLIDPVALLAALELGPVLFVRKPISSTDLDSAVTVLRHCLPGDLSANGRERRTS